MGVGVGGAVARRLEVGPGARRSRRRSPPRASGDAAAVSASKWSTSCSAAGAARPGYSGSGGQSRAAAIGALDEPLEAVVVEAGGGRLRDAAAVDHDAQAHVIVVARHVLVDAAVGEPRERVGALPAGDQRLGAIADEARAPGRRGRSRAGRRRRRAGPSSSHAHPHVGEAGGHRRVTGVADLDRLALAAVGGAPEHPLVGAAHHVHRRPEPRADARVGGVAQHLAELAVLDLPRDLAAELEVEALVVDRPRAVRVHVDAVVGGGDHLLERAVARQEADVGHPHHRQPGGAVGADHPAGGEPDERRRVAPGQHADPGAVLDDVDGLGRHALVVVAEAAERAGQGGVGGDVHEVGAVAHRPELRRVEPGRAGEGGLPAEDAVELDGVADRLVDLQRHLLAAEDQRGGLLGALRRAEQRLGLLGDARARCPSRSISRTTSQPRVPYWPRTPG